MNDVFGFLLFSPLLMLAFGVGIAIGQAVL